MERWAEQVAEGPGGFRTFCMKGTEDFTPAKAILFGLRALANARQDGSGPVLRRIVDAHLDSQRRAAAS